MKDDINKLIKEEITKHTFDEEFEILTEDDLKLQKEKLKANLRSEFNKLVGRDGRDERFVEFAVARIPGMRQTAESHPIKTKSLGDKVYRSIVLIGPDKKVDIMTEWKNRDLAMDQELRDILKERI